MTSMIRNMHSSTRILCIMHFLGNAILLWVAYAWLSIGESSMILLTESILLGIVIAIAALWLHGSALAHFAADDRSRLRPALGAALRHLPPLFLLAIMVVVLYGLMVWLDSLMETKTGAVRIIFDVAIWLLRWFILPVLLLPLATSVATRGFLGFFHKAWGRSKNLIYWVEVVVLLLAGIWVPLKLVTWVPKLDGFGLQMTSFLIRLFVAYLLFVVAWLLLESFSSGGKPRTNQAMTASAP
jgi:hypothetical protein